MFWATAQKFLLANHMAVTGVKRGSRADGPGVPVGGAMGKL